MIWFRWCHNMEYWYIYYIMILQDDILYDDITWWYYMIILYDNEMSWGYGDGYIVLQALMDGPMIEATYGETMIHSTKGVWEMLAQEEWLGCCHDISPVVDILGSTPVYYVLKSICIIKKKHCWSLTSSWPDDV